MKYLGESQCFDLKMIGGRCNYQQVAIHLVSRCDYVHPMMFGFEFPIIEEL